VSLRLDLASGRQAAQGYEGVDLHRVGDVAYLCDLNQYPWTLEPDGGERFMVKDESVKALYSSHFVEHVVDLIAFMNEAHRVLEPGGLFTIRHPYQFSVWAWQDPTHVRALNEFSWAYFDGLQRKGEALHADHYLGITADFEIVQIIPSMIHSDFPPEKYSEEEVLAAMRHSVNVCLELTATLRKR
jgi:SAM-dependent methyltransferase